MAAETAEAFARSFSQAWLAQDAAALGALFAEDADFLSLTGAWAEGRGAIEKLLRAEWKGAFAKARLVTGRGKIRPLGPVVAVTHQRFVLSGIRNADGSDGGRISTVLMAVLSRQPGGWMAVSAQFTAEGG
jgi:uncharacterized protein (TIGR02246 family)